MGLQGVRFGGGGGWSYCLLASHFHHARQRGGRCSHRCPNPPEKVQPASVTLSWAVLCQRETASGAGNMEVLKVAGTLCSGAACRGERVCSRGSPFFSPIPVSNTIYPKFRNPPDPLDHTGHPPQLWGPVEAQEAAPPCGSSHAAPAHEALMQSLGLGFRV